MFVKWKKSDSLFNGWVNKSNLFKILLFVRII